jgi:hypothetical protein
LREFALANEQSSQGDSGSHDAQTSAQSVSQLWAFAYFKSINPRNADDPGGDPTTDGGTVNHNTDGQEPLLWAQ